MHKTIRCLTALSLAFVVPLSGCGHSLYLIGRTTGAKGSARVATAGNHSGDISINLGSKIFSGRWVYAPTGGSIGFGSAVGSSGVHFAAASSTLIGLPTGGDGSILASASDGATIRCVFQYSEWGSTGLGFCQDSSGEIYDLQIN